MRLAKMNRVARIVGVLGLLLAAASLAACAKQPAATQAPSQESPEAATPAVAPTMELVTPTEGAEVAAGDVEVAVKTTGHTFTMASNTNVAGEGHVHFTLDDRPFEMSIEPSKVLKDVEPGEHTLVAELVQNNTDPFDPPVKQEITFVAK